MAVYSGNPLEDAIDQMNFLDRQKEPGHECVICKEDFLPGNGIRIIDSEICNKCDEEGKTTDFLRSCGCDDRWIYELTRHHISYL